MRGLLASRLAPAAVVVAALAAAYSLAAFTRPLTVAVGAPTAPVRAVPVATAIRACAAPGQPGASGVALIAAPAASGSGQADIRRLNDPSGPALVTLTRPGELALTSVKPATRAIPGAHSTPPAGQRAAAAPSQAGVVVQASGAMARGLDVEQLAGSMPTARCDSPGTDFWFVGPGQRFAGRIELFLMNPGGQAADVNVEIATDAGPLQGSPDTGISVAPHSMLVQSLSRLVRGSQVVALHVRTSVGQVVASVEEITGAARSGGWLPAAQSPATRVVIPGLPSAPGTRNVYVTVPGASNAHLRLTAVTSRGSYEPTGAGALDLPGGSAADIALPSLAGIPAAIELSANVPVTASVMISGGPAGAPGAVSAASPPLQEQGVVADNRVGSGAFSEVVLSAPWRAASARIWRSGPGGASATSTVRIPAAHSVVVQLGKTRRAPGRAPVAVVITPLAGSGPLYAGRVVERSGSAGSVETILPVWSSLTTVPLPPLRQAFITTAP